MRTTTIFGSTSVTQLASYCSDFSSLLGQTS